MDRRHSRGARSNERAAHDETDFFSDSQSRKTQRKDRQLCGQAQRAISLALSDLDDEVLSALWVVKVEPAPTASRLMIWVAGPRGSSATEILARLHAASGILRAEVASAICRKQVPVLAFAISEGE
jgi:ribosome-binding factor A